MPPARLTRPGAGSIAGPGARRQGRDRAAGCYNRSVMTEPLARPGPADPAEDSAILTSVDRATAELRRGAMVVLADGAGRAALVLAAETASEEMLRALA